MTSAAALRSARAAVRDVAAGRALRAFYVCVLAVALAGSAIAATGWLGIVGGENGDASGLAAGVAFAAALGAVSLYELGGVAVSIFADRRRQLGERATSARLLSAAFAAGAVALNVLGHDHAGQAAFFGGFSALGYLVWLLDSGARRRDALRSAGKLPEPPPVYGLTQWARHPWITRRARSLAVARAEQRLVERITSLEAGGDGEPTTALLGPAASLAAAVEEIRADRRLAAIRGALGRRIRAAAGPGMARLAVSTYDLPTLARMIAAQADYPAMAALIGAELTPARLAARPARRRWGRRPAETGETGAVYPVQTGLPAGARLLPIIAASPAPDPDRPASTPGTAGAADLVVPAAAATLPIVPLTAETAPVYPAQTGPDRPDAGPVHTPAPDLPAPQAIPAHLLPYIRAVTARHTDWHLAIGMPPRHPDALTIPKILTACGISGKQTGSAIRQALLMLCHDPAGTAQLVADVPMPTTAPDLVTQSD